MEADEKDLKEREKSLIFHILDAKYTVTPRQQKFPSLEKAKILFFCTEKTVKYTLKIVLSNVASTNMYATQVIHKIIC